MFRVRRHFLNLSFLSRIIIDTVLKICINTALAQSTTLAMDPSLVTVPHLYQNNGKTDTPGESQVMNYKDCGHV